MRGTRGKPCHHQSVFPLPWETLAPGALKMHNESAIIKKIVKKKGSKEPNFVVPSFSVDTSIYYGHV